MANSPQSRPLLALSLRLLAIVCLSTMAMLVKLGGDHGVHLFEIMFWRQFITVPLILAWLLFHKQLFLLKTPQFGAHIRRAGLGVFGMSLMFGSFLVLPLAEATTLNFTVPLFATLLSMVMLKEHIGLWRWSALAMGFAGVIVITQPGSGHLPALGAALGLGSAFLMALLSIYIKDLNRSDHPLTIVFWFAALGAPLTALSLPFVMTPHDGTTWALLIATGLAGTAAQLLLTLALRFGEVSSVIVMDYTGLIWATLYGALIWNHLPPAATWFGAPLIIGAGLIIIWREHALSRAHTLGVTQP
ncbi:MAG: DMT family transporter [Novosphingobium sp.]